MGENDMKKIYSTPEVRAYQVSTTSIIATSIVISHNTADKDYVGGGDIKVETNNIDIWGEEW